MDADRLFFVTLRGGFGIPSVVAIDLSGTGSIFLSYDTEKDPNLQGLGMALAIALQAQAGPFLVPIWDWQGRWWWVGGENEPIDFDLDTIIDKAMDAAVKGENQPEIVPDDYRYESDGSSNYDRQPYGYQTIIENPPPPYGGLSTVVICSHGMPGPNPKPGSETPSANGGNDGNGDKPKNNKDVVLADSRDRSTRRRSTLITVRSQDNTTFTTENPVWDDGTPDYSPSTATMTNGDAVVAWMNERAGIPDSATIGATMAATEIAVARWNAQTSSWTAQNITDDLTYDRSPVLRTATNGTAAVAWIRNVYTNYIGSAMEPNQICFARYVDGTWTIPEVAVPSAGRVRSIDLAYDGVRCAIAYNEEDDPSVGTNQHLCVTVRNDGAWSRRDDCAISARNYSPVFAFYDGDGCLTLLRNDMGTLMVGIFAQSGEIEWNALDMKGHSVLGAYAFTRSESGSMACVWPERMERQGAGNTTSDEIVATRYNPSNRKWSAPQFLTDTGRNCTDVSAAFKNDGSLDICYVCPNTSTNANGIVRTTSADWGKLNLPHCVDLAILKEDVQFSPSEFSAGDSVTVSITVRNLGDMTATNIYVYAYGYGYGENNGSDLGVSLWEYVEALEAGESMTFDIAWTVPESYFTSEHAEVYAEVWTENWEDDKNSLNNFVSVSRDDGADMHADAEVSLIRARAQVDSQNSSMRHVVVALRNSSTTAIPAGTQVFFMRGGEDGEVLATKTAGKLNTGVNGECEVGFDLDVSSLAATSSVELITIKAVTPDTTLFASKAFMTTLSVDLSPVTKSPLTAYNLKFDANGGKGDMPTCMPFYGDTDTLSSNTFSRAGFTFEGWALSPTGSVVYCDGSLHKNIPMHNKDTASLYAIWKEITETRTTEVSVPFEWIQRYFPDTTNTTSDIEQRIANFEACVLRPTGKSNGQGGQMAVWQDYVAGTDPTNTNSRLVALITSKNGKPQISWDPNLNTNGEIRTYTIYGKKTLSCAEDWHVVDGDEDEYKFFRVSVEMK